jgi:hypothetical protein
LAREKANLIRLKGGFPLNPQEIINVQIKIEGLEDGLGRLIDLKEELF